MIELTKFFWVFFFSLMLWLANGTTGLAASELEDLSTKPMAKSEVLADKAMAATAAFSWSEAEEYWTEMLDLLPKDAAIWSNRGNVRVSQGKLMAALEDHNQAIALAPSVPDAYVNRGIAFEALGRYPEAIADYNQALSLDPEDPVAYNNRGNAAAGKGDWQAAVADYHTAWELAPNFAFARNNWALALYQTGETQAALTALKNIVRKYPKFADARAALTAALWVEGKMGEAESNWFAAVGLDSRYRDIQWVAEVRRWPPAMVSALDRFLNVK